MNKVARLFFALCLAVFFLLYATPVARAQSTFGSIRGVATDDTGAAIPGSAVTLKSVDQSTTRTAVSDGSGAFLFENLKPGRYTVSVALAGR
jgi:uncharacterized protein (DUF2141 family)